jgi:aryl-alcohol dehydrogenase-like predicted oxidoreductase
MAESTFLIIVGNTAVGKALKGRRDKVFLMTKVCTHGRDAALGHRNVLSLLNYTFLPIEWSMRRE